MKNKKRYESEIIDTTSWADVFYLEDLNNGTYKHRGATESKWYNLRLKPNSIRPYSRHYCLGCGPDINKMLRIISKYVSTYANIYEFYNMLDTLSDNGRIGRITMEQADEHWKEYGNSSVITKYDKYINKAIALGKDTRIITGHNVSVEYNENKERIIINGIHKEWFEYFLDLVINFKGHTKQEFYELLSEDCDIACMNEIFSSLKKRGCKGIADMKKLSTYRWLDVLVPLVNDWEFGDVLSEEELALTGE